MEPIRALTLIGTRPEAIKLAPVVHELDRSPRYRSLVCTTGQHRELLDQALEPFDLHVDFDLDIMRPGQSLTDSAGRCIERLGQLFQHAEPEVVIVQGDTTTAFCGALAGFYHGATVAHVEAGLRTLDRKTPFPEEMHRRLVGRLADLHFAPTTAALDALLAEDVPRERVTVTGNTGIDALLWMRDRNAHAPPDGIPATLRGLDPGDPLVLMTGHRRESFDGGLEAVCRAVRSVADAVPDLQVVYPVHLNPSVQRTVHDVLGGHDRIHLTPPLGYAPFVWLLARATLAVSDSGGLQEEAPALGTPLLVTREETERMDAVEVGSARLVGHDPDAVAGAMLRLLRDPDARAPMEVPRFPFGDGTAARRIVDMLDAWTGDRPDAAAGPGARPGVGGRRIQLSPGR